MIFLTVMFLRAAEAPIWGADFKVRTKLVQSRAAAWKTGVKGGDCDGSSRMNVPSQIRTMSMTPAFLNDLSARLKLLIESTPVNELDKNVRAFMTGAFAKMDLVTREEFDIQKAVLERTRAKLQALEAKVAELESARDETGNPSR